MVVSATSVARMNASRYVLRQRVVRTPCASTTATVVSDDDQVTESETPGTASSTAPRRDLNRPDAKRPRRPTYRDRMAGASGRSFSCTGNARGRHQAAAVRL